MPRIPLRGDTEIPQLGFGVFQVPREDLQRPDLCRVHAELGADEMRAIAALDAGERTGPDPDAFTGGWAARVGKRTAAVCEPCTARTPRRNVGG